MISTPLTSLAEASSLQDSDQILVQRGDTLLLASASILSGSGGGSPFAKSVFGSQESGIPAPSRNVSAMANVGLRAVGGGQGDAMNVYVLDEATYLAHQAGLAAYLATPIAPALALTIGSGGDATGSLASVPAGAFVVLMRVGASVDAPIFLYQTA